MMCYVSSEERIEIAEELATLFCTEDENMSFFVSRASDLYKKYDVFTADKIMRSVRLKICDLCR